MAAGANDRFNKVISGTTRPVATTLSAQKLSGATSASLTAATGWDTDTALHGIMYRTDAGTGAKVAGSQIDWKATLSGTTLSNFQVTAGTDDTYAIGTTVELAPTAAWGDDMATGIVVEHNQDGTHDEALITSRTEDTNPDPDADFVLSYDTSATALKKVKMSNLAGGTTGWVPNVLAAPDTVTANGNRSYDLVFNSTDYTDELSAGMRLKLTRTVTAPTQCTSLTAGSSHYYSRASGSMTGMTFTGSHTTMGWVKLTAYPASDAQIIGRTDNATGGFSLSVKATGQLRAFYGGASSFTSSETYQSLPLNKWVHVAASVNAAAKTVVFLIDGVSVPYAQSATAATSLVQTSNFEIGRLSTNYLSAKFAQLAVFSTNVATATLQGYISQGLSGSETNLVSAYSFNGVVTDLNANANTLTANNGVVATNPDTPFTQTQTGITAGTQNYAIITAASFSTNTTLTVQVPEGDTIPTSGGVSAVSYSTQYSPYGFPGPSPIIGEVFYAQNATVTGATVTAVPGLTITATVPTGRPYRLTLVGANFFNTSSTFTAEVTIWDGTVGSGVQLGAQTMHSSSASYLVPFNLQVLGRSSGSKTFNVGLRSLSGGVVATIGANATNPTSFILELL